MIANKAQFTSDCETIKIKESTDLKRKRIKKKRNVSQSSSDEELQTKYKTSKINTAILPDFPQIKKNNGK